jgi:tetratricopeptide (TPR) repeat protein
VARLTRWQTVLTAFLTAAAAVAALSVPFHALWLKVASVVVAAIGAVVAFGLAVWRAHQEAEAEVEHARLGEQAKVEQARLEAQRMQGEMRRRLRVPVARVSDVDPTGIGVDPAALEGLSDGALPQYLPRLVDAELQAAIQVALADPDKWFVVVVGSSKAGKSRTLFEALRRCDGSAAPLLLVAPEDSLAVEFLLGHGLGPSIDDEPAVLWLDDIEPFLNQGLTLKTLRHWQDGRRGRIVAATYGGRGGESIADSLIGNSTDIAGEVLQYAQRISLEITSAEELEPLRGSSLNFDFDNVRNYGLAAYLVAGPRLEIKLGTGLHQVGEAPCPHGVALVNAAIDWARCGRTDAIHDDTLRALWEAYLTAGIAATNDAFAGALAWALRPVAATITLLQRRPEGGYQAYDYAVQLRSNRTGAAPPKDMVWAAAIETASPDQALGVANAGLAYQRLPDAVAAFTRAAQSTIEERAVWALVSRANILALLDRTAEALHGYQQVIDRYGNDPDPSLRGQATRARFNRVRALVRWNRSADVEESSRPLIDHYSRDPDPEVRRYLAEILNYLGAALGDLDRFTQRLDAYQEVVDRYSNDPDPVLRDQVAKALVERGAAFIGLDRFEEALAEHQQVVYRYGDDPDPSLRQRVAVALFSMGYSLGRLERLEDALALYQQVVDRYGNDPDPDHRQRVAAALVNKGAALVELERLEDALALYQQVVDRYGNDPDPRLHPRVAAALVNKGAALVKLERFNEALFGCQVVIDRYGDDPSLGQKVADAYLVKYATLIELDRFEEALAEHQEVIDRYGNDPDPALRPSVCRALASRGYAFFMLGRFADSVTASQHAVDRYGDDPNPAMRQSVASALGNLGHALEKLDRFAEALAAYEKVSDRYADDPAVPWSFVAEALIGRGLLLDRLGQTAEAAAAFIQIIERYGNDPARYEKLARSLVRMGLVCAGLVARYGDDPAVCALLERLDPS